MIRSFLLKLFPNKPCFGGYVIVKSEVIRSGLYKCVGTDWRSKTGTIWVRAQPFNNNPENCEYPLGEGQYYVPSMIGAMALLFLKRCARFRT